MKSLSRNTAELKELHAQEMEIEIVHIFFFLNAIP